MIARRFEDITKADIDALVTNAVAEGRTIDYKRKLPGTSDDDKREFLADVSSFANAAGGDIVYGVDEASGIPTSANGLTSIDPDAEILRLDSCIRSGIDPRVPGVQIKAVDGFPAGPVMVVRIPKSWSSPHVVTFKNLSRFFSRTNAGKFQMDVTEIRSAFLFSEAIPERMRRFRDERLGRLVASESQVPLAPNPILVLHVFPLSSFSGGIQLSSAAMRAHTENLQPIRGGFDHKRFNIDGVLTVSKHRKQAGLSDGYCQLYRNGVIESVDAGDLGGAENVKYLAGEVYERDVIRATHGYLKALQALDVLPPYTVTLSLLRFSGVRLYVRAGEETEPIDRDVLLLPDVLIEEPDSDIAGQLRPLFDAVCNAAGRERSLNYDEHGNWIKSTWW